MKISTFKKVLACTALASAVVLTGCQQEELMENQFTTAVATETTVHGQAIEGQYIVVFKDGSVGVSTDNTANARIANQFASASVRQAVLAKAGIGNEEIRETFQGSVKGFAARLSAEQLKALRNSPEVAYIEQDRIITLGKPVKDTDTTDGESVKGNGGTTKGGGKPTKSDGGTTTTDPAPTTEPTAPADNTYTKITPLAGELVPWNIAQVGYGDGTGKTVWVVDSGVDTDHPDLTVDLARSKSFVSGVTSVEDGYGHGTTVTGIIAAKNNGSGMIGVAAGATVVALRVFDDAGAGTLSSAISAVIHIDTYGKPGDVVNLSIGSGISSTMDNAVKSAAAKGILFAIAAGNSGVDCINTTPARVDAPGVYTVSAMDSYARLWDRSNYGLPVDCSAPGVNVTTTTKGGSIGGGAYGTSFAAPHVAGVLLLRGKVYAKGTITGDKDSQPDPIASVE
ncbi:S8 family serine peptidase [Botryobacter ruber]|uniref:S8 family serine peptidase n=1 Tax=Botryobacter ruber TaxID=2171629 RepID=UPI001F0C4459|nr:S8 family serine peptidase [Botryobacter ruber]